MTAYTIGVGERMTPAPYEDTLRRLRDPRLALAVTGLAGLLVLGRCTKVSGGGGSSAGEVASGRAAGQLDRQIRDSRVGKPPTQNPNPHGKPYHTPGFLVPYSPPEEALRQEPPDALLEPNPSPAPKPENALVEEPSIVPQLDATASEYLAQTAADQPR